MLVYKENGMAKGLYRGLSASLLRQAVYSSTRFGVYDYLKRTVVSTPQVPFWLKILSGSLAGGIGAAVASPFDLTLVRMQADGRLPLEQRRNYKHVVDGVVRITREEGPRALFIGVGPTTVRAIIITASQFAFYDQIKEEIIERKILQDGFPAHFVSAFCAGFVSSVTSNPVDVVKTRLMNSAEGVYRGAFDCAVKTVSEGGSMALYKGFLPTFVRQAPYVITMFITLEQIKRVFAWIDSRQG